MDWPWKKTALAQVSPLLVNDAMEDMAAMLQGGQLTERIEAAISKSLDPSHLQHIMDGDDTGGYFQQEFDLRQTAGKLKGLYTREPWVYATSQLLARSLIQIPYLIKDKSGNVLENHPLYEQINAGSAIQDGKHRDWSGGLDLSLGGNYFMVFDEDYKFAFHVPVEMVNLKMQTTNDPEELERVGMVKGIEIMDSGGFAPVVERFIPWEQVVHFRMPNPYNPFYGLSMYSAAARPILLDRHKTEFETAFYLRGATNAGVIETTEEITRSRMNRLMSTFEKAFTGKRNWWRTLFLPAGSKWVNSGLTMTEMQHLEGMRENRLTLLAVLGVPPSQVGIVQDVNRATAETQEAMLWNNTVIPMSWFMASGWNASYLVRKIYGGDIVVEPDLRGIDAVEGSLASRAEQARAADNMLTINEQREVIGYVPLKEKDPRGNMFLVELQKFGLGNPFGPDDSGGDNTPNPDDMGPEVDTLGMSEGNTSDGTGDNRHSHPANWDKDTGDGETMGTQGGGPDHQHKIKNFQVQPGGDDNHYHADLKDTEGEKAAIALAKRATTQRQRRIEREQSAKYARVLDAYYRQLFAQVKEATEKGVDIRAHLMTKAAERQDSYADKALPVLDQTMGKGFDMAMTTTKNLSNSLNLISKGFSSQKEFRFTDTDEQAIGIIQERTSDGQRRLLAQRGISMFQGFDGVATENIMNIIESGLSQGKSENDIGKNISSLYGESYGGQAHTITRTEILSAISDGGKWQQDVLGEVFTEVKKQWFHVGDVGSNPDAREAHLGFQNEGEVPSDHVYMNGETGGSLKYPRDPQGGASDIINCRCSITAVIPPDAQSNANIIVG